VPWKSCEALRTHACSKSLDWYELGSSMNDCHVIQMVIIEGHYYPSSSEDTSPPVPPLTTRYMLK
jgi:hypothetical protein